MALEVTEQTDKALAAIGPKVAALLLALVAGLCDGAGGSCETTVAAIEPVFFWGNEFGKFSDDPTQHTWNRNKVHKKKRIKKDECRKR
jgi:hypothetical protein